MFSKPLHDGQGMLDLPNMDLHKFGRSLDATSAKSINHNIDPSHQYQEGILSELIHDISFDVRNIMGGNYLPDFTEMSHAVTFPDEIEDIAEYADIIKDRPV